MCKEIGNADYGVWQIYNEQNTSSIVCGMNGLRKAEKMSIWSPDESQLMLMLAYLSLDMK